jgi:hypothetical protein
MLWCIWKVAGRILSVRTHGSTPDQTSHTDRQTAVNVSQYKPIQTVEEASPVSDFCQHERLLDCTNYNDHMTTEAVTRKYMSLPGSSDKRKNT